MPSSWTQFLIPCWPIVLDYPDWDNRWGGQKVISTDDVLSLVARELVDRCVLWSTGYFLAWAVGHSNSGYHVVRTLFFNFEFIIIIMASSSLPLEGTWSCSICNYPCQRQGCAQCCVIPDQLIGVSPVRLFISTGTLERRWLLRDGYAVGDAWFFESPRSVLELISQACRDGDYSGYCERRSDLVPPGLSAVHVITFSLSRYIGYSANV